jgi:F-type H+-transporting ATPase subunit b
MHIDWFVFLAQIVNFLILVYLLKYFLYNRILNAMDAREARIASQFEEARQIKEEAQKAAEEYGRKNRELHEQSEEFLNQAHRRAEQEKDILMDRVREDVEQVRQRWYETLARERNAFLEELRRRVGAYVHETIRRVLSDMADDALEGRMVQVFARRIREMDGGEQELLKNALKGKKAVIRVHSAFTLDSGHRQIIEQALEPYLTPKVTVRYDVVETVGAGIELMARGYKLSWSIRDYLAGLEEKFIRALKEEIRTEQADALT